MAPKVGPKFAFALAVTCQCHAKCLLFLTPVLASGFGHFRQKMFGAACLGVPLISRGYQGSSQKQSRYITVHRAGAFKCLNIYCRTWTGNFCERGRIAFGVSLVTISINGRSQGRSQSHPCEKNVTCSPPYGCCTAFTAIVHRCIACYDLGTFIFVCQKPCSSRATKRYLWSPV